MVDIDFVKSVFRRVLSFSFDVSLRDVVKAVKYVKRCRIYGIDMPGVPEDVRRRAKTEIT